MFFCMSLNTVEMRVTRIFFCTVVLPLLLNLDQVLIIAYNLRLTFAFILETEAFNFETQ